MNSGIHVMNDVKDRGLEMTLDRVGETANSDNGIRMLSFIASVSFESK